MSRLLLLLLLLLLLKMMMMMILLLQLNEEIVRADFGHWRAHNATTNILQTVVDLGLNR